MSNFKTYKSYKTKIKFFNLFYNTFIFLYLPNYCQHNFLCPGVFIKKKKTEFNYLKGDITLCKIPVGHLV